MYKKEETKRNLIVLEERERGKIAAMVRSRNKLSSLHLSWVRGEMGRKAGGPPAPNAFGSLEGLQQKSPPIATGPEGSPLSVEGLDCVGPNCSFSGWALLEL